MIRFFAALLALTLVSSPVLATDDGGFGTERFFNESPAALEDGETPATTDPGMIEPAAGVEDNMGDVTGADGAPEPAQSIDTDANLPYIPEYQDVR